MCLIEFLSVTSIARIIPRDAGHTARASHTTNEVFVLFGHLSYKRRRRYRVEFTLLCIRAYTSSHIENDCSWFKRARSHYKMFFSTLCHRYEIFVCRSSSIFDRTVPHISYNYIFKFWFWSWHVNRCPYILN